MVDALHQRTTRAHVSSERFAFGCGLRESLVFCRPLHKLMDADDDRHDATHHRPARRSVWSNDRDHAETIWLIALIVMGYVSVWTLSGVLLQLLYWLFGAVVGRIVANGAPAPIAGGVLLAIAGLYQFSMLKHACLQQCRSPMSFLRSRWQGGNEFLQALRIGLEHGAFCVGCCWSLMLLIRGGC